VLAFTPMLRGFERATGSTPFAAKSGFPVKSGRTRFATDDAGVLRGGHRVRAAARRGPSRLACVAVMAGVGRRRLLSLRSNGL